MSVVGLTCYTHRLMWQVTRLEPIPVGMDALHKCDVKCCIEPTHLYLGTQTENNRDFMLRRFVPTDESRSKSGLPYGVPFSPGKRKPYYAKVGLGGHRRYLGNYATAEEAGAVAKTYRDDYPQRLRAGMLTAEEHPERGGQPRGSWTTVWRARWVVNACPGEWCPVEWCMPGRAAAPSAAGGGSALSKVACMGHGTAGRRTRGEHATSAQMVLRTGLRTETRRQSGGRDEPARQAGGST